MSIADSMVMREVMRDIGKHPVDSSGLVVHVTNGVIHLTGKLDKLRGYYEDTDLQGELNMIMRLLRQKPGIRDVICEVELGGPTIKERLSQSKVKH